MNNNSFPRFFFPDDQFRTVEEVNYEALRESGIRACVFDLDNTIARWEEERLEEEILELFDCLTGLGLKVGILTNSRRENIEKFISDLPFPHLFNASKPRRKGFMKIAEELGVRPEEVAMIGDQLLTDVLGANRAGMYTIRVDPLDPSREYKFTKINRVAERILLGLRELYRFLRS